MICFRAQRGKKPSQRTRVLSHFRPGSLQIIDEAMIFIFGLRPVGNAQQIAWMDGDPALATIGKRMRLAAGRGDRNGFAQHGPPPGGAKRDCRPRPNQLPLLIEPPPARFNPASVGLLMTPPPHRKSVAWGKSESTS